MNPTHTCGDPLPPEVIHEQLEPLYKYLILSGGWRALTREIPLTVGFHVREVEIGSNSTISVG
jgi:hypothetical protein